MVSSRYFLLVVSGLEYTLGIPGNLPTLYLIKAIFCTQSMVSAKYIGLEVSEPTPFYGS